MDFGKPKTNTEVEEDPECGSKSREDSDRKTKKEKKEEECTR